ncbi:PfkB family carbohydrate kinase [Nocardia sp. NPDC059177]|uniref:PfkB family carbohydrate kinase n=1 Tax=Nocardia sp. NPDC059177 TaxID=3346759 RepID=UPI0036BC403D
MVPQDPRTDVVRAILARLGKFSGVSADRLRHTEIGAMPILELPVVTRFAQRTGIAREDAVLPVLSEAARQLPPSDRLIVDATLVLGLLREPPHAGIDPAELYAVNLGARREYLAQHWIRLHTAIGADAIPDAPTVKRLRSSAERGALTALAVLLTAGPAPALRPAGESIAAAPLSAEVVTVVGDAVIDHLYRVDAFPAENSPVGGTFTGAPGGKGLNRAVAAARLGLDVRLLAAIGADDNGERILDLLARRRVGESLVKVVPEAATLVTAVVMTPSGEVRLIGCRDPQVQLLVDDLDTASARATLNGSAVVVLTFEQPVAIVERILGMLGELPDRPQVIVCAAPALAAPQELYLHLDVIDYLIGTTGELDALLPEVHTDSPADTARRLRGLGVSTVCAVDGFACTVYSDDDDIVVDHFPQVLKAAVGAAAAFAAALAYRVVKSEAALTVSDFTWCTAAMLPTQKLGAVSTVFPDVAEIDRVVHVYAREAAATVDPDVTPA